MRGVPSQVLNRLRLFLLAVACWFCLVPTAHAIRPPTPAEELQLKEKSARPEPSTYYSVCVIDGEMRIGLFVANNPINRVDPFGLWSPGAHDALLEHALKDILPQSELDILKKSSRDFDKATQSTDESYKHSMSKKGQTPENAIKQRDKFINDKLNACKKANADGNRNEALRLLGEALHPIMDASSPMHTDSKGNPKEWNPLWPFGHSPNDHIGNETIKDITPSSYEQQDKAIRDAYEKVLGK